MNNIEHDLEAIAQNEWVRSKSDENFTNFLQADEKTFRYNIGKLEQKIITVFNRYRATHPFVHSVLMGRENGSFVRSHKRARSTRYDPRKRSWYVLGKENAGKIMRIPPFQSVTTPDVNTGFVKAQVDDEQNLNGVLGIFITLADLMRHIADIEEDMINSLPPDVAKDAAKRIREAADMGDITQLKLVAEALTSQTQPFYQ